MKNESPETITEPDKNMAEEEMTVELELDEGTITCSVVTIFRAQKISFTRPQ